MKTKLPVVLTLCGVIIVSLSYQVFWDRTFIWKPAIAALSAAALYSVVYFSLIFWKKEFSLRTRIIPILLFAVFLTASAYSIQIISKTTQYQRVSLNEIRTNIDRGIAAEKINSCLFKTYREYLGQEGNSKMCIGDVFRKFNPGGEKFLTAYSSPDDGEYLYISNISPDSVTVIFQSKIGGGVNPEFKNFDGGKGKIQEKGTLIEKGVKYVTEN